MRKRTSPRSARTPRPRGWRAILSGTEHGKRHAHRRRGHSRNVRRPLGRDNWKGNSIRQWQLSAPAAGRGGVVTVSLPALSELRPGWRLASAGIVILTCAALAYYLRETEYYVYDFELSGARLVPITEIYDATGMDTDHILWIDPAEVKKNVEAVSGIQSAAVQVAWPAGVIVSVIEREPVVAWRQAGEAIWLDRGGMAFEQRIELPEVLPIEVDDASTTLELLPDKPVVGMDVIAGALQLRELRPNIELLHYDSQHGLSYQDGRGWRGYFGTGTDMDVKLAVYETLVQSLVDRQIQLSVVSVENIDAPYYRR